MQDGRAGCHVYQPGHIGDLGCVSLAMACTIAVI
jgi:hypothetical protein